MSTTDTNTLLQRQFAESATHTPTNLQVFNDTHQQEQEQQSQTGGQNELSTDQNKAQNQQLELKRRKITNGDRAAQLRERDMRRSVNTTNEKNRPENTKAAYGPKQRQWNIFCQKVYPEEAGSIRMRLTKAKTQRFLFYQAHRSKYKRGGKKRKKRGDEDEDEDEDETSFDLDDFNKVEGYHRDTNATGATEDPKDPVGFSQFNTYVSSMRALHERQVALDGPDESTYTWEAGLFDIDEMKDLVKLRKTRVNKATHVEKITTEFSPFLIVEAIPKIEEKLWERNSDKSAAHAMVGLRDRFTFVTTLHAILRGESLFKAELSDMLHLIHAGREPTPMAIFILQMATGKTNEGGRLYGRLMRHRLASLCGIGGLGFYLLLRFKVTGEMSPPPDFTVNKDWFDIKLLVGQNATPTTNTTPISDRQYADVIKRICNNLQVPACHFTHIGRVAGPPVLELEEIQPEDIRTLGNWNPGVQEKTYSTKLPFRPMRVMSTFPEEKGLHWSPRQMKVPDESLQGQLWPWIEAALEAVNNAIMVDGINRYTALAYLKFMKYLRIVILQDAAVLLNEGRKHRVFEEEIFSTPGFLAFQAEMVRHCREATNPCDGNLDQVMPRMNERLGNMQSSISVGFQQSSANMHAGFLQLQQSIAGNNANIAATIAESLRHAANAFSPLTAAAAPDSFAAAFSLLAVSLPAAAEEGAVTGTAASTEQQSTVGEPRICLYDVHHSVTSMYNEWHGIGKFLLIGPAGGLCAKEREGKRWRNHFAVKETARYSKLQRVVQAVHRRQQQESGKANGLELASVLAEFDGIMKEKGVGNLSNLVLTLQSKGYIPKETRAPKTSRKLSSSPSVSTVPN
jgi:hypothetical protein